MYDEYLPVLYDCIVACLEHDVREQFDIDIYYILEDMYTRETKTYIIDAVINMLKRSISAESVTYLITCVVFDIIFKYVFDIDCKFFSISEKDKETFIQLQYEILTKCEWIIIN